MRNLKDRYSRRRIALAIASGLTLLVLVVLVNVLRSPSDFPATTSGVSTTISISSGEAGTSIARSLQSAGVVKNFRYFVSVLLKDPSSLGIAPGAHTIDTHIPSELALTELLDQKRILNLIVVKDASTTQTVLSALHSDTNLLQGDALKTVTLALPNPAHSLEGELGPDQYSFSAHTSTHDALTAMTNMAKTNFQSSGILAGYQKYGPYQLLTIASLLQIEADPSDYANAAEVIYNRLAINMPLQLNSTVAYAQGLQGSIGLTIAATHVPSAYNTYLHTGLPPTPICNPSLAALRATLHPARGSWLYFITVKPHDTRFTDSYSQFETWVALYNHNVAMGAFK